MSPPNSSFPRAPKELAALFAGAAEEVAIGPDYRGTPVLATLRRIPNSSWFIAAQMDLEEIHAPVRQRAYFATLLVVVLLLAAWANVASIWRRQRAEFYRKQYEAEIERHALEKQHAFLTKYANADMTRRWMKAIRSRMRTTVPWPLTDIPGRSCSRSTGRCCFPRTHGRSSLLRSKR